MSVTYLDQQNQAFLGLSHFMFTGNYSSSTILLHTKSKKSLTKNKLTYSLNTTHETKVVYFLYDNFPL